MSWPFGPAECPACRYFEPLDPPGHDDSGYEIVGGCRHPRIAMELFRFKERDPVTMAPCPCSPRPSQLLRTRELIRHRRLARE